MTIDEKRLAEIRGEFDRAQRRGGQLVGAMRELLAMLDATRATNDALARQVHRLTHGEEIESDRICEHALAAQIEIDEVRERADTALDATRARAEDAERKLAALHAAAQHVRWGIDENESGGGWRDLVAALDASLTDTAPVAERHDREVRAKELRRVAEQALTHGGDCPLWGDDAHDAAGWLNDEADRIERGEA